MRLKPHVVAGTRLAAKALRHINLPAFAKDYTDEQRKAVEYVYRTGLMYEPIADKWLG